MKAWRAVVRLFQISCTDEVWVVCLLKSPTLIAKSERIHNYTSLIVMLYLPQYSSSLNINFSVNKCTIIHLFISF